MSWFLPQIKSDIGPAGRGGHCLAALSTKVVLFGGADRAPTPFEDLWVLECEADVYQWTRITPTFKDGVDILPRTGATMCAINDKIYMYGGQDPMTGVVYSDVTCLDTDVWEWSKVRVIGDSPPPRHSHVAAALAKDRIIVVHGGSGPQGTPLDDLWVFNLDSGMWTRPAPAGDPPAAREMAAACVLGGDRILIHGGRGAKGDILSDYGILDAGMMRWVAGGLTPYPRCSHTAVLLDVEIDHDDAHGAKAAGKPSGAEGAGAADAEAAEDVEMSTPKPGAPGAADVAMETPAATPVAGAADPWAGMEEVRDGGEAEVGQGVLMYGGFSGKDVEGSLVEWDPDSGHIELAVPVPPGNAGADGKPPPVPHFHGRAGAKPEYGTLKTLTEPAHRFAHAAVAIPDPAGRGTMMLVMGGCNMSDDLRDVAVWRYTVPETDDAQHETVDAASALLELL
ncbi:unnamed protein product [Pedinophyceae sp. YPF-701]|nr:unnamed protein product [Pedinophyceae sp. YPF-701]